MAMLLLAITDNVDVLLDVRPSTFSDITVSTTEDGL